jgi:crotonobetainyl-CoA:carnitine CoA-transferase CaiB-like acyl-CoA transferase
MAPPGPLRDAGLGAAFLAQAAGKRMLAGPPVVDYVAGLYAAFAVMAGLAARDRTGAFQRIDVAMRDCALAMMGSVISDHLNAGIVPQPVGNIAASGSPSSGVFATADGLLALAANHKGQFRALCTALGRADLMSDPHYADPAERRVHATQLREDLSAIFAERSASEWEHLDDGRAQKLVGGAAYRQRYRS